MHKLKYLLVLSLFFSIIQMGFSQEKTYPLQVEITIDEAMRTHIKPDGRLLLFMTTNEVREPRTQTWPRAGNYIFATNYEGISPDQIFSFSKTPGLMSTSDWQFDQVPAGTYKMQVVWDHDQDESRIDAPGNVHSEARTVVIGEEQKLTFSLSKRIGDRSIAQNRFAKEVTIKSALLSDFWSKEMSVKASVLLPSTYFDEPNRTYPVRYNVAGYGGRYTRINRQLNNESFMEWWMSEEAPQIITVYLDGEGPFGDSYQMDSENSGPYGQSLISEVIPHIESNFRGIPSSTYRFVDGCSTGGWVSLALQMYYPDDFNGVWSYSPDAVEFENYQLINIYEDENAYINEHGIQRPVMRSTDGEPMMLLREFIQYENVLGRTNSYITSGGQFSAHNALYSPRGANGLPQPIFDPVTGVIDETVAKHWKKYDMKIHAKENWNELGPKLQGKVYIWMGDMDNFYLNPATRALDEFLDQTEQPKSDADIVFTPMARHCEQFSHRKILEQINARLKEITE